MTGGDEEQKKGEAKGFAGLSSLVSDMDTMPPPIAKAEPAAVPDSWRPAPQAAQTKPNPQHQTHQVPAQTPAPGSFSGMWMLGIVTIIGLFWIIGHSSKSPTSTASHYSPPTPSATPYYSHPAEPEAPSGPRESIPPVGQDEVLSADQIRYCLAEKIRLEGANSVVNNSIDSDVDRFNSTVDDYNSRCGSFRYRSDELESARQDVELHRSQLQYEGRSRFAGGPSTGSLSTPTSSRPAPDATVQAIQRKLNELNYEAGTADGLMGRGTRSAILDFQQDRGLAATGVADQALLLQLQFAPARSAPVSSTTTPSSSTSSSALATAPTTPQQRPLSGGRPDLTNASVSEQALIENACKSVRQYRLAADYYSCLRQELAKLSAQSGKPDLTSASRSEQSAIENACGYDRQYRGPGDYYNCLRRELRELASSQGKPDFSQIARFEQASVENACNYDRQYRGPGAYYRCLHRELEKLR